MKPNVYIILIENQNVKRNVQTKKTSNNIKKIKGNWEISKLVFLKKDVALKKKKLF